MIVENARKCDRCGSLFELDGDPVIKIKRRKEASGRVVTMVTLDLCDTCCKEIIRVLDNKEVTFSISQKKRAVI